MFISLIGNDVCNGRIPTEDAMTTPEEFYTDTLDTLAQLNDTLPRGSNVIITGLADGRILWDTLYNRMHPLGEYKQDSTYEDVYTWLECLQVSPCNGWVRNSFHQ